MLGVSTFKKTRIRPSWVINYTNLIHEGSSSVRSTLSFFPSLLATHLYFPFVSMEWMFQLFAKATSSHFLYPFSLTSFKKNLLHKSDPSSPYFLISILFFSTDSLKHKTYPIFPQFLKRNVNNTSQCLFLGFSLLQYLTFTFYLFSIYLHSYKTIIYSCCLHFHTSIYFPNQCNLDFPLTPEPKLLQWSVLGAKFIDLVCVGHTDALGC